MNLESMLNGDIPKVKEEKQEVRKPEPKREPLSDITLKVKQFLLYFLTEDPRTAGKTLEIEAKLGRICVDGRRIDQDFPVLTATVLHPDYPCQFVSDMTVAQHKSFNEHLNATVDRRKVVYKHTRMTDRVYDDRVRVTTDDKTGDIVETIRKEHIDNLHILSPMTPFDVRITVNIEHPADPPSTNVKTTRKKDRLTYSHAHYQVDLTQVKGDKTTHELELELTSPELSKQAMYESQGLDNSFDDIVGAFTAGIVALTRL